MNEKHPINLLEAQKISSEWKLDTKGYFLIDPKPEEGLIYAHYYTSDKKYVLSISGKDAESIYYTVLRKNLIDLKMHAAYLGSELQKAELHLKIKNSKYIPTLKDTIFLLYITISL
jgi:hypothetical protein